MQSAAQRCGCLLHEGGAKCKFAQTSLKSRQVRHEFPTRQSLMKQRMFFFVAFTSRPQAPAAVLAACG